MERLGLTIIGGGSRRDGQIAYKWIFSRYNKAIPTTRCGLAKRTRKGAGEDERAGKAIKRVAGKGCGECRIITGAAAITGARE